MEREGKKKTKMGFNFAIFNQMEQREGLVEVVENYTQCVKDDSYINIKNYIIIIKQMNEKLWDEG